MTGTQVKRAHQWFEVQGGRYSQGGQESHAQEAMWVFTNLFYTPQNSIQGSHEHKQSLPEGFRVSETTGRRKNFLRSLRNQKHCLSWRSPFWEPNGKHWELVIERLRLKDQGKGHILYRQPFRRDCSSGWSQKAPGIREPEPLQLKGSYAAKRNLANLFNR